MKSKPRNWLHATLATAGAGALALGGAVTPAFAEDSPSEIEASTQAELLAPDSETKYERAAAQPVTNHSAEELKALESAGEVIVSDHGFVAYIDDARDASGVSPLSAATVEGGSVPGDPASGSRPGANVTIYLNFGGATLENTAWNFEEGVESLNFAPATHTDAAFQEEVWAAVAEDFAPFDVNVTTTNPGSDALNKTSEGDSAYGVHVIVTDSYTDVLGAAADSSGIALLGGSGAEPLNDVFVFTQGVAGGDSSAATAKSVADTASHEAAHSFGLDHDGIQGSSFADYYYPQGGVWGPIMGATYAVPISQWSNGDYAGATNQEDDLAVMTDRSTADSVFIDLTYADGTPYDKDSVCVESGDPLDPQPGDVFFDHLGGDECGEELTLIFAYTDRADFAADEVGNTPADAMALDNENDTFEYDGAIVRQDDVDVFRVDTDGGAFEATVDVADIAPNLNTELRLLDEAGNEIATDSPDVVRESADEVSGLGASISETVEAGVYYLEVEGVGFGDPSTATEADAGGFSAYGSLGYYFLEGEAAASVAPVTEAPVISEPTDGSESDNANPTFSGTGVAGADLELTVTAADGTEFTGNVTVDANGAWSTQLDDALDAGTYTAVATQTVDGVVSENSNTVEFEILKDSSGDNGDSDSNDDGAADGNDDGTDNGDDDANSSDDQATSGTDGDANGNQSDDQDNLAMTGAGTFVPYAIAGTAILLLAGGVVAAASMRQRKLAGSEGDI